MCLAQLGLLGEDLLPGGHQICHWGAGLEPHLGAGLRASLGQSMKELSGSAEGGTLPVECP